MDANQATQKTLDGARKMAHVALEAQKQMVDFALAQHQLVEKQLAASLEMARQSLEMGRDLLPADEFAGFARVAAQWQIDALQQGQKNLATAMEAARFNTELVRDLQQSLGSVLVDSAAPAAKA